VNKEQDRAFAQAVQDKVLAALRQIDPSTANIQNYDRKVKEQKLRVLKDIDLGNTTSAHPCRACLVEVEFMDTPAVEKLFRLDPPPAGAAEKTAKNRQKIADALAYALLSMA
jgi:N-acetylmuramoyl-L-alanine amidase